MDDNREAYRLYLLSLVLPEGGGGTDSTALFLFRALDKVPFTAMNRMDDNRIADAMDIRREFHGRVDGTVTLLEILVELSLYLAYAREKLVPDSDPWRWFTEMVRNAGISEEMDYSEIVAIGRSVVANQRSLFPIGTRGGDACGGGDGCDGRTDGGDMELWMQLNRYLVERYHA